MYDTILVPTDGSEHARRAASHAAQLATAFEATVHVLSVVDVAAASGPFDAGGVDEEYVSRLQQVSDEAIDDVTSVVGTDSIHAARREGSPATVVVEYVEENEIDLVAMGTHGRTGIDRFVAGSVTESVLRKSPVPVLTVRASDLSEATGSYDDILLPTDGSDAAEAAVADALAVAEAFDATVHVVNVVDAGAASGGNPLPTAILDSLQSAGEESVESIAEQVREHGLDVVTDVSVDFPARGLLDYTEEQDVDLIAMGTTGQTGLSRFLLGSTTERIVRHANIPVLAVNARET